MLQLINAPDTDFSGLFDSSFSVPDAAVSPGLPPTPGTLSTFLPPTTAPPATSSVYPGPPGVVPFTPQPPAPLLPAPAPAVKEEAVAVPSSQPQPGVMLTPSFIPTSSSQFSPQPVAGYQSQHGFSGEDTIRGSWGGIG